MKWIFSTLFHIIIDFVNKPKMGPFRLKCYLYYHYRLYIVVLKIRRQWRNKPVNNKRRGGTSNKRIRKEITNKKTQTTTKIDQITEDRTTFKIFSLYHSISFAQQTRTWASNGVKLHKLLATKADGKVQVFTFQ